MAGPIVQGVAIFTSPVTRIASLAAAVVLVAFAAIHRGSFRARAVVEVRREAQAAGRGLFRVVASGRAVAVPVRLILAGETRDLVAAHGELARFSDLRSVTFDLSGLAVDDVEVWVHEVTGPGASVAIRRPWSPADRRRAGARGERRAISILEGDRSVGDPRDADCQGRHHDDTGGA